MIPDQPLSTFNPFFFSGENTNVPKHFAQYCKDMDGCQCGPTEALVSYSRSLHFEPHFNLVHLPCHNVKSVGVQQTKTRKREGRAEKHPGEIRGMVSAIVIDVRLSSSLLGKEGFSPCVLCFSTHSSFSCCTQSPVHLDLNPSHCSLDS